MHFHDLILIERIMFYLIVGSSNYLTSILLYLEL